MLSGDADARQVEGQEGADAQTPLGRSAGEARQPAQPIQMSHMLSTISHEIKNPLASLKLNAQMVTRAIERGRQPRMEAAALLTQAVDDLDTIASDLSDAVRADSDRFALTLTCLDLAPLIQRAATEAAATYQRPIATELPRAPLSALVDEGRIRQALARILDNAARYTPAQQQVTLAARRSGKRIRVEARDQGAGIATHDLPYIFDPFYRGAAISRASASSGLGLSLYIVRRIVERHGGKVGAQSTPGQGATVWFTLPYTPCS